jgi:hypothetical protein
MPPDKERGPGNHPRDLDQDRHRSESDSESTRRVGHSVARCATCSMWVTWTPTDRLAAERFAWARGRLRVCDLPEDPAA